MIPVPSLSCLALVKHFESFSATAYRDVGGIWTIGYGSTFRPDGSRVQPNEILSIEVAEEWLALDIASLSGLLEKDLPPAISLLQHEADALCALVYNIGIGNFKRSLVRKLLVQSPIQPPIQGNARTPAADGFLSWTKARVNGKLTPINGLIRRRHTERSYFLGNSLRQAYLDGYAALKRPAPAIPEEFAA